MLALFRPNNANNYANLYAIEVLVKSGISIESLSVSCVEFISHECCRNVVVGRYELPKLFSRSNHGTLLDTVMVFKSPHYVVTSSVILHTATIGTEPGRVVTTDDENARNAKCAPKLRQKRTNIEQS